MYTFHFSLICGCGLDHMLCAPPLPFLLPSHTVFLVWVAPLQSRFLSCELIRHTQPNNTATADLLLPHRCFILPLVLHSNSSCTYLDEQQHPLLRKPALTKPKVSLKLTSLFFLAGSEQQWVGLCVSGWPMWPSLLCCLLADKVEPEQLRHVVSFPWRRSTKFCSAGRVWIYVCLRVCVYAYVCVLDMTVWIKKSLQQEAKVNQCAQQHI